jgi:hypothetical protein
MLLINKTLLDQHNARVIELRAQHEAMINQFISEAPQPIEFTQVPDTDPPFTLTSGFVCMPGNFYNDELNIIISKDDTNWVPA